ncbi:hypothetical protein [Burkholderia sp. Ac-20365]|uniref:hypothetical protein n=1 Tax=Burkholderia sp. Ac-20365 TaxID=2703897 RepID=UPI00197BB2AE|nr:hypothetical protein [Burkholderia sp. Ac-20365]MBN3761182.1 hypothetical protein [Burkholderia sp. Ac-20365]
MIRKVLPAMLAAMSLAATAQASQTLSAPSEIKLVFAGNTKEWNFVLSHDKREVTLELAARHAAATDIVLVTDTGVVAYDIASNGTVTPNADRRILRDGEVVELDRTNAVVLELPEPVVGVEFSKPFALAAQTAVRGRYIGLKYIARDERGLTQFFAGKGPQRMTVKTEKGSYTFTLTMGTGGAPVYKVAAQQ